MNAVEFETYIQDGRIELPTTLQGHIHGYVRVTIVTDVVEDDMVEFLFNHPYTANAGALLQREDIYDRAS